MIHTMISWGWDIAFAFFVILGLIAEKKRDTQFSERIAEIEGLRRILSKQLYEMSTSLDQSRELVATGNELCNLVPRMRSIVVREEDLLDVGR